MPGKFRQPHHLTVGQRWAQDKDTAAQLKFAKRWISSHVAAAAGLGKPLVLGEFGMKGCCEARAEFYQKVPSIPPLSIDGQ